MYEFQVDIDIAILSVNVYTKSAEGTFEVMVFLWLSPYYNVI